MWNVKRPIYCIGKEHVLFFDLVQVQPRTAAPHSAVICSFNKTVFGGTGTPDVSDEYLSADHRDIFRIWIDAKNSSLIWTYSLKRGGRLLVDFFIDYRSSFDVRPRENATFPTSRISRFAYSTRLPTNSIGPL